MEEFVYSTKHLGALKKYGFMKLIFLFLGCLVLLLQSMAWLIVFLKDLPVTTSSKVFVTITQVFTLMFIIAQCFFFVRNKKIIKEVKKNGTYKTLRNKLNFSKKASFGNAIAIFYRIITVVVVLLLGILTVSFIQNYVNWGKVILKMPFMVLLAVELLHSSAEFRFQAMIEKC